MLSACVAGQEQLQWQPVGYDTIQGWDADHHAEALIAFIKSCQSPKKTNHAMADLLDNQQWQRACNKAEALPALTRETAKHFFESNFTPYRLTTNRRTEGLLTGYYIPVVNGSLQRTQAYRYPVYAVPPDLTRPYFTRKEIEAGALSGKGLELAWFDDPVIPFFIQIQGSGRVRLPDGKMVDVQYADKNGHAYTAIGKVLLDEGKLTKQEVTMDGIKKWLREHPQEAPDIMNRNASYVFFSLADAERLPKGSQGIPLTPERSLAIDHTVLPYGLPVFVQTLQQFNDEVTQRFEKLLITQDRGGAIKGPLRGDIFFGQGADAGDVAGDQKFKGWWTVLIPTEEKNIPLEAGDEEALDS